MDSNTKIRIMTRQERQQMWSQMARAEGEFTGISVQDRRKASELLGKAQADFVEVRVAPIVTDPQMSEDELLDHVARIFDRIKDRMAKGGTEN